MLFFFFFSLIFLRVLLVENTLCFLYAASLPGQSSVGQSHGSICPLPPLGHHLLAGRWEQQGQGREQSEEEACVLQALCRVGPAAKASQCPAHCEKQKNDFHRYSGNVCQSELPYCVLGLFWGWEQ